jgi:hypothetical protein
MQKLLFGLAGLNLILAGYLAVVLLERNAGKSSSAVEANASLSASAVNSAREVADEYRPPAPRFTWASLASPDLRRYAHNLRQVGCPEETIHEIMLAEVNRLYRAQEQALKVRSDDVAPWETAARPDRRSGESRLRQLLEEKRALLKELTGVDVGIDMPSRLAGRNVADFENAFAAVPEFKRDQVRAIQEQYWAQSDEIKQRTLGYLEPEDREEFLRIKAERRAALAEILTPRELQDYEIKSSATAASLKNRFEGFEPSDEEFRKIFDFMQPLDEQYSLSRRNPDPLDREFTASRAQAEQDLQAHFRSVLGEDRYAEYQRSRDPAYRKISQLGAEAGLPHDSVLQAYQAQQQMREQWGRIQQSPDLTQEQRAQQLLDLLAHGQQTMQQLFGDKGAQILRQMPDVRMAERYGILPRDPGAKTTHSP